jgi:hypothetical protein
MLDGFCCKAYGEKERMIFFSIVLAIIKDVLSLMSMVKDLTNKKTERIEK